jgi:hypothetical protein
MQSINRDNNRNNNPFSVLREESGSSQDDIQDVIQDVIPKPRLFGPQSQRKTPLLAFKTGEWNPLSERDELAQVFCKNAEEILVESAQVKNPMVCVHKATVTSADGRFKWVLTLSCEAPSSEEG